MRKTSKAKSDPKPAGRVVKFDPIRRYMTEIKKYGLLTREKEKELAKRVRQHDDESAAEELVRANLRLVVKFALRYHRISNMALLDLIQEGNIGLILAVHKYDPGRNVKFSHYASFWIKAYIFKYMMDNWSMVKIGTTPGQRKLFFNLKKEKQKLADQGIKPEPGLVAEAMGMSEQEVVKMDQRLESPDVSLNMHLTEDSESERIDFIEADIEGADETVARKEIQFVLRRKIKEFKSDLNTRERQILEQRLLTDTPSTLQQIGDQFGISRERVRQLESGILNRLRGFFDKEVPDLGVYFQQEGAVFELPMAVGY